MLEAGAPAAGTDLRRTPAGRAIAALLAAVVLSGCSHQIPGPGRVLKPEGETVTVEPASGLPLTGELLGLRGAGLVLLREGRLLELPLEGLSHVKVRGYRTVRTDRRELLLLFARYPQGLGEEQWRELLRERGQTAFDAAPSPGLPPEDGSP